MANEQYDIIELSESAKRTPAFCDCQFPDCAELNNTHPCKIVEQLSCHCGEDSAIPCSQHLNWRWQQPQQSIQQPSVLVKGGDIIFHPSFSQGTAIVRGEQALKQGMIHFWEMRVITEPCGTDVMFGIGTDKVDLQEFRYHFVSALGTNAQSWGLSYRGVLQHNGDHRYYSRKISQGCILGVYMDRTHGQLEFFLNRRPLGIAYSNIIQDTSVEIYPMVSSTAARSIIRLINSTSLPDSLQFRAMRSLARQPIALAELEHLPGLRPLRTRFWFLTPPVRYSPYMVSNDFDIADEAVLPSSVLRQAKDQPSKPDIDITTDDLYADADVLVDEKTDNESNDSPEHPYMYDQFDEHFHYLL